jgi:hypothetical protein
MRADLRISLTRRGGGIVSLEAMRMSFEIAGFGVHFFHFMYYQPEGVFASK